MSHKTTTSSQDTDIVLSTVKEVICLARHMQSVIFKASNGSFLTTIKLDHDGNKDEGLIALDNMETASDKVMMMFFFSHSPS